MTDDRLPILPPVECPNCRRGIARMWLFWRNAWSRWRCPGCGALLGTDTKRRLLAVAPWTAIVIILLFVFKVADLGLVLAIPVLAGAALANFFLFDRVVLLERTGFYCRRCGYDLHGQTDDRCPECGGRFDPSGQASVATEPSLRTTEAALHRRRFVFAVAIALASLTLVSGILVLRWNRSATSPPSTPATGRSTLPSAADTHSDTDANTNAGQNAGAFSR